jgi:hypothetical protein
MGYFSTGWWSSSGNLREMAFSTWNGAESEDAVKEGVLGYLGYGKDRSWFKFDFGWSLNRRVGKAVHEALKAKKLDSLSFHSNGKTYSKFFQSEEIRTIHLVKEFAQKKIEELDYKNLTSLDAKIKTWDSLYPSLVEEADRYLALLDLMGSFLKREMSASEKEIEKILKSYHRQYPAGASETLVPWDRVVQRLQAIASPNTPILH